MHALSGMREKHVQRMANGGFCTPCRAPHPPNFFSALVTLAAASNGSADVYGLVRFHHHMAAAC